MAAHADVVLHLWRERWGEVHKRNSGEKTRVVIFYCTYPLSRSLNCLDASSKINHLFIEHYGEVLIALSSSESAFLSTAKKN